MNTCLPVRSARTLCLAALTALALTACGGNDGAAIDGGTTGTPTGNTTGGTTTGGTTTGGTTTGGTTTGGTTTGGTTTGGTTTGGTTTGGTTTGGTTTGGTTGGEATGRVFLIEPGANATQAMVDAMIQLLPGDTLKFGCGYFELATTLLITNTEDVKVQGCGKDATVLSFKNNPTPEGILVVNMRGLVVEDLTVLDTGGNGIELRAVDHGTLRRVRTIWSSGGGRQSASPITAANAFSNDAKLLKVACTDPATLNPTAPENQYPGADTKSPDYTVSDKSGRYGIYPVSSENILIEHAESVGASDAGIYVGQTNNAIIRNSRAAYNVFGFEIENVQGGEYDSNVAECNTGGFLIYDLDGLRQYGDRSRMHGNISRKNNTYNFTEGGFVSNVPSGSGMITLSYDRIDIFDNVFEDNNTAGIIHTSYELFPEGLGRPNERRIDWYTEGLHVWNNTFRNNGNGLPLPNTNDLQAAKIERVLPSLVGLKNAAGCLSPDGGPTCAGLMSNPFRGGHILWDGLLDSNDANCPYPVDAAGNPVPKDARGKPIHTNSHPNPACHYNQYKFDQTKAEKPRIMPDWFSCIHDNEFSGDSLTYANFHGLKGLEAVIAAYQASEAEPGPDALLAFLGAQDPAALQQFASDFDVSPHDCVARFGKNMEPLPPVTLPPFERSGEFDSAPSNEVIAALCNAEVADGEVNFGAARVNCPTLDQYHLFADPEDPRSAPNGDGVPFSLNTKLFSDYSVKYRLLYLPPGTKATYQDKAGGTANSTIIFPVGTIIAKTFAFRDETKTGAEGEVPVETRLLIKRTNSKGTARWDGLPYVWQTENGKRVARLAMGGRTLSVAWNQHDVDSNEVQQGTSSSYLVPNTNQCLSCHSREDAEPGSAPIGTKVRFMNRAYRAESTFPSAQADHEIGDHNQIAYLCERGLMAGCPTELGVNAQRIATALERSPIFNKPGDSGFTAGSDEDIEARARAYLEVNCQHCHNERGFAASTGLYLDSFAPVDQKYGICKAPTATGATGSGGRRVDIHPGDPAKSILEFRLSPAATTPAARMPPLARSIVHAEGHALIEQWIRDVVVADESKYPGSTSCPQ